MFRFEVESRHQSRKKPSNNSTLLEYFEWQQYRREKLNLLKAVTSGINDVPVATREEVSEGAKVPQSNLEEVIVCVCVCVCACLWCCEES